MSSDRAWARSIAVRAAVVAVLLALPAPRAGAQDDRYPAAATPRVQSPVPDKAEPVHRWRHRHRTPAPAAAAPKSEPPKVEAPITTATVPPRAAAPTVPPGNPALAGVPLDPGWPKQVFVIGDSVMLGAKPQLAKGMPDWQVTFQGRPALMVPRAIEELPYRVGPVAVIALGYNSLWYKDRKDFDRWAAVFDKNAENIISALKARGAKKIVWVMLRELNNENVPTNGTASMQSMKYAWYFPYVNERLRVLKERHPEIALADWATAGRPAGLTYDAIHLNPRGAELMVDVVRTAIGLGPRPAKEPATSLAQAKPPEEARARPDSGKGIDQPDLSSLGLRRIEEPPVPSGPLAKPTYAFRDCAKCPEMVVIPAGSFTMGAAEEEADRNQNEGPPRIVTVGRPFAVGKFEVTFAEWEACVAGGGCKANPNPGDEGWGKERRPVINVSWDDAQEYVAWLTKTTAKPYRLLTEAEWEYAARAGTNTAYSMGPAIMPEVANFQTAFKPDGESREGEYREKTIAVGTFPPNAFDLHDMHGNVWEWVQDNWHEDYVGAPTDGAVRPGGDATMRTKRGGGWYSLSSEVRAATREGDQPDHRGADIGFRVARGL